MEKYLREIFDMLAFNSFWLSTYWRLPVGNRVVQQEVWGCADFKRFLAFYCRYLLCLFVFCLVCLFWSVAHLEGERGDSHRAICYFEGRLRKDLKIQYRIIVSINIIIITIFIIICCYGGRPCEDLNVNQLNFPAMVPPPNCEFGIVNKVRFKDYSPRGSIVDDAKL